MRSMYSMNRERGMTMVESLVSLVVISIGLLGIAALYLSSLKAGRAALLQTHAINLASDMADRIRANRPARAAYDMATYGGNPATRGCVNGPCDSAQLAQDDLARWLTSIRATLPGRPQSTGNVVFAGNAPDPDAYTITVGWQEAGSNAASNYSLIVQQ
ncbi:MAG TPA: type IV pilus modification protein PilV [Steroidobacteraceae bacterium]|nr:type IV pilus modification protein PilV [Steroidobacteraceae bacterium]